MNATVTTGSTELTAAFDTIFAYLGVLRVECADAYATAQDVEARGVDPAAYLERARSLQTRNAEIAAMAHELERQLLAALPCHD